MEEERNIFYKHDRESDRVKARDVKKRNKPSGIYEKASKKMHFHSPWQR